MRSDACAALTMVWNAPVFLRKWVAHYGAALGRANLFVLAHGPDPRLRAIAEGCNYLEVPRVFSLEFEHARWRMQSEFTSGLTEVYRAVICGDVDELVVPHPRSGRDLAAHLAALPDGAVVAPVGLEIVPGEGAAGRPATIDWDRPILAQMPRVVPRAAYSKPCIATGPVRFGIGGHAVTDRERFAVDGELLLFHLKYVDPATWAPYDQIRREIAAIQAARGGGPIRRMRVWQQGVARIGAMARSLAARPPADEADPIAAAAARFGARVGPDPAGRANGVRVAVVEADERPFAVPEALRQLV